MNANREMTLTETSSPGIRAMAPRNEMGIPRLTQNASRSSRKSASTTKTSRNPVAPLRSMRLSRSLRTFAWSCQIVSEMPSGSRDCESST